MMATGRARALMAVMVVVALSEGCRQTTPPLVISVTQPGTVVTVRNATPNPIAIASARADEGHCQKFPARGDGTLLWLTQQDFDDAELENYSLDPLSLPPGETMTIPLGCATGAPVQRVTLQTSVGAHTVSVSASASAH